MSITEPKQLRVSTGITDNDTVATKGYVDDKFTDTVITDSVKVMADADGWIKTTALATMIQVDVGADVDDIIVNYSSNDVNYAIWGTGVVQPLFYTHAGNNIVGIGTANPDTNFMLTVDGNLKTTGAVGSSASRVSKGWYTDLDSGKITVDNLVLDGNTLSSTSGDINITPDNPADHIIINGHWDFDGKTLVAISDSDTTLTAYVGKNITIEGVTFDGGVIGSVTNFTVDNLNLNGNTITASGTNYLYLKSGTNRPVIIGDGLVTSFNNANLVVDGVVSDDLNGPHIATFVSTDLNRPLFYVSSFAHDDVSINFDAYKVSGNYISSDAGSNYQIHKNGDGLLFRYESGISPGNTITWDTAFRIGTSGLVNFFGSIQADIINEHTGGAGVTIDSVVLKDNSVSALQLDVDEINEKTGSHGVVVNHDVFLQGSLTINQSQTVNVTIVNASTYDLLATDYILNVTYTLTGAVTSLTIPDAQFVVGRTIHIKDAGLNAGTNSITLDTIGATKKIEGNDTLVINADGVTISLYCGDSNNFFVF